MKSDAWSQSGSRENKRDEMEESLKSVAKFLRKGTKRGTRAKVSQVASLRTSGGLKLACKEDYLAEWEPHPRNKREGSTEKGADKHRNENWPKKERDVSRGDSQ